MGKIERNGQRCKDSSIRHGLTAVVAEVDLPSIIAYFHFLQVSKPPKNIAILGATGSIGRSSLEVIRSLPDRFRAHYLIVNKNIDALLPLIKEHRPRAVAVLDGHKADSLRKMAPDSIEVLSGAAGVLDLMRRDDLDLVISAMVGYAGLEPTLAAIRSGKSVALANKETLVVAGQLMTALVAEHKANLVPIDSEHSAILQCLTGEDPGTVAKLILTASGGPFLHASKADLEKATVRDALNHPNWKMGNKITIDSATLMNKGLEVIEARWLFGLPASQISVVIHPQSIIHSMVEFVDGSIKAQLGLPDMKLPIQYALTYPERLSMNGGRVNFPLLKSMTFFEPDKEKFRSLQLAYDALNTGGTAPAALNAANEVAVEAFLQGTIAFSRIPDVIGRTLDNHRSVSTPELPDIVEADRSSRRYAESLL